MDPQRIRESGTTESQPASPTTEDKVRSPWPKAISQAEEDWDFQSKKCPPIKAIDNLMNLVGLEPVERKFVEINTRLELAKRQKIDASNEKFGAVFVGNPGTGMTKNRENSSTSSTGLICSRKNRCRKPLRSTLVRKRPPPAKCSSGKDNRHQTRARKSRLLRQASGTAYG